MDIRAQELYKSGVTETEGIVGILKKEGLIPDSFLHKIVSGDTSVQVIVDQSLKNRIEEIKGKKYKPLPDGEINER